MFNNFLRENKISAAILTILRLTLAMLGSQQVIIKLQADLTLQDF
ncbi:hypothetical protein F4694_000160 [Bacillus niacini]|uniref:Uncharacterized protein n=1 Tax=Neobacillus niacini TaxID=86668 RepID=A0A852T5E7_9BACI|nr:hypothetical protein [Neobacillus niacini]